MKIVINSCYGGFSLSSAAVLRYAELKGITLYQENCSFGMPHFYKVPVAEYHKIYDSAKLGQTSSSVFDLYFSYRDIERTDSCLIQTVMELGSLANDDYSKLTIVDIPDDIKYTIEEYDGREHVAEIHRTWT